MLNTNLNHQTIHRVSNCSILSDGKFQVFEEKIRPLQFLISYEIPSLILFINFNKFNRLATISYRMLFLVEIAVQTNST